MSDWHIRLARAEDAEFLPAIELAAGQLFRTIEGLAGDGWQVALRQWTLHKAQRQTSPQRSASAPDSTSPNSTVAAVAPVLSADDDD